MDAATPRCHVELAQNLWEFTEVSEFVTCATSSLARQNGGGANASSGSMYVLVSGCGVLRHSPALGGRSGHTLV